MFAMLTKSAKIQAEQLGELVINQERLYSYIGDQLRSHREQKGVTQQELADLVNLERTSITNIERGRQKLPIHVLFGICKALGVGPNDVMPRVIDVAEEKPLERVLIGDFSASLPAGIARLMVGEGR